MIFTFYCDESHDSPNIPKSEPTNYVIGGFFSNERTWNAVEKLWKTKNKRVNVSRFHAAHLNHGSYEYDGWGQNRRIRYSKHILRILKRQGKKLHGFAYGLQVDEYRNIISEGGQRKMGHPYLVCFKSLVASVAQQMDIGNFPHEDKVAFLLDQNADEITVDNRRIRIDTAAIEIFNAMRDNPDFQYRHRLDTCRSESSEELVCLQCADYVAYEMFKLIQDRRNAKDTIRHSLQTMLGQVPFMCELFSRASLTALTKRIDETICNENALTVIPKP